MLFAAFVQVAECWAVLVALLAALVALLAALVALLAALVALLAALVAMLAATLQVAAHTHVASSAKSKHSPMEHGHCSPSVRHPYNRRQKTALEPQTLLTMLCNTNVHMYVRILVTSPST